MAGKPSAQLIEEAPNLLRQAQLLMKGLDQVGGLTVVQWHDVANLQAAIARATQPLPPPNEEV